MLALPLSNSYRRPLFLTLSSSILLAIMVFTTRTLGIIPNTKMSTVDFSPVEEVAVEWTRDSTYGGKYMDVFIAIRNLLTAAGDSADSSTVAATAIANFIRDEA